ncbi:MAG: hypothetical protein ACRCZO_13845 [Cetobacterium sp.]
MKTNKTKAINQKIASLEKWRANEVISALLMQKDNGNYMYSLKEIQDKFVITYNQVKKICRDNNINR